ncbi:PAS domain S-box protein [Archangium violaceum]|uniref:PAS domain-containing sensor histidine kinase n=1 Tax=Archangium violaceum TaxID=83451 RepID=UPI00193C3D65|nr:PAS domain-containing sensor histidine kinase [Archangium violaceum]QRK08827.1 PAS domain S-box protein [Archangium violaceum]
MGAEDGHTPVGIAHLEQAAQQAQMGRYGALASLGQLALQGLSLTSLVREALAQILESLELSQGVLLEHLAGGRFQCVASFGASLEPGRILEPSELGGWRTLLATRSLTAEVFGQEARVPLTPLGTGARGILVRLPDALGETVALLALAVYPERRLDVDTISFLQAVAHILGAAITRERQERTRREEVARLEALLERSPLVICLKGPDGRYAYVNRRFAAYLRRSVDEVLGRTDEELFPSDMARRLRAHDDEVRASGEARELEEELELPEGALFFLVERFPLHDPSGGPAVLGLMATDISGLKRAERELRRVEAELRQMVDGLHDQGIIMLDAEGRVASWSRGAERLKGYRTEEIIGRSVTFIHEGELSHPGMVREMLAQAAEDGRAEFESWCIRKDGTRFLSEDTVFPLWSRDGEVRGFSVVSRDVTERHLSRTRLERSEARYRLVSRATRESIWEWELLQNRMEWGEQALGRLGYAEEEDASHPSWWEARIHPADREEVLAGLVHVLEDGEERWSAEFRFLRGDGSYAWVRSQGYVVREDGRPVRLIGAMADITRRRRAEEARSRLYLEAQEAIRLRDEFLSVASHELKTPITPLQLHLQTLRVLASKGSAAFAAERVTRKLELAEHQVRRLARLVDDLLDISRLNSGRMELRFETVDVARLVRELLERQRTALQNSGSEVRLQLRDARMARVDPMRLEQILTHLLANAAKYGRGKPIDVTLEGDEAGYCIRIRDRGIGIAPEDQQRIFERFERAASERHYGGLGLGLWIVRRIAMHLGGSIEVRSQPGEGATFEVRLPRFPLEARPTGEPDAPIPMMT